MGVTMGHWHLNSRDIEATKKILVDMGGTAMKAGNFQVVKFPGVFVFLHLGSGAAPATGGTVGTVVNHVGFLVPNVQQAMAKWKAAGVPVVQGGNGRLDQAFVTTPDGLRIEILEDKAQTLPIRHHHIHFYVPEAQIPAIQAWYEKVLGGLPGKRKTVANSGVTDCVYFHRFNVSFSGSDMRREPTKGRSLDHIGFDVKNLEAFCKKLEAAGIKLDRPYTKNPQTGGGLAFIYDPWGTYIELNERPDAVYIQTSSRE